MERNTDLEVALDKLDLSWTRVGEVVFPALLLNRYPVEMTDQKPRFQTSAPLRAVRAGFPQISIKSRS